MKKTILTSASILALSMAAPIFAQSAPAAPATPTAVPGTPECATAGNNCSLINQAGTNSTATVLQSGSSNTSDIDQKAGTVQGQAKVTQSGSGAQSYILQENAGIAGFPTRATVNQSGAGAESTILQTNARNDTANVTQIGDSTSFVAQNGSTDTVAEVLQQGGDLNTAIIFQEGGNKASVGDGNPANSNGGIVQTGSSNNAEIYQGDFTPLAGRANGTRATTTQTGNENDSIVIQNVTNPGVGGTDAQRVDVVQTGNENGSSVVQTGLRDGQRVNVLQSGNENLSRIEQSDLADSAPRGGNIIDVKQFNDQNDSFVDQKASTATARVTQTSSGLVPGAPRSDQPDYLGENASVRANYSRVVQQGTGIFDVTVDQGGTGNRSDVAQTAANGVSAADVDQNGVFNNSAIRQTADAYAKVTQGGAYGDNNSFVDQSGSGASATIMQNGDGSLGGPGFPTNESFVTQEGANTIADVTQNGSQNFSQLDQLTGSNGSRATVVQTTDPAGIASSADQNVSFIEQTAITTAYVEQIGQSNYSKVTQSGDGASAGFTAANVQGTAVYVSQKGFNGSSEIEQTEPGTANEAVLIQTDLSMNEDSEITQSGNDNLAVVTQSGMDNFSDVLQSGDLNTATVNQSGTNNDSYVDQGGNNNTALVNQYSSNNYSSVNQSGNGNMATVTQGSASVSPM
ncbi:MAG: hypothetical protein GW858_01340 [Sphingomonadales bacterium]|nr:hypothetical protein [Sphingomonadales bacterium]NCQ22735.1 hypothetical protein [Sphingomonadales bacterium]